MNTHTTLAHTQVAIDRAKYAVDGTWVLQDNWCFNACLTSPVQVRPRVALTLSQFFDHRDEFQALIADAPIQDKPSEPNSDTEGPGDGGSSASTAMGTEAASPAGVLGVMATPPSKTPRSPSAPNPNPKTMTDKQLLACITKLRTDSGST